MSDPAEGRHAAALAAWTQAAAKSAPGGRLDALNWLTPEGISVKPLYTAADVAAPSCPELPPNDEYNDAICIVALGVIAAVATDNATVGTEPARLAVTSTCNVRPASAAVNVYVEPVAPATRTPSRNHAYRTDVAAGE